MILDVDIQEGSHKTFSGQPAGCSDLLQAQSSILLRMQEYRIPSFCQKGARLVIHTNVPLRIDRERQKDSWSVHSLRMWGMFKIRRQT